MLDFDLGDKPCLRFHIGMSKYAILRHVTKPFAGLGLEMKCGSHPRRILFAKLSLTALALVLYNINLETDNL